jgi:hypothetical protein
MLAIKQTPMPSQSIASNAVFNAGHQADSNAVSSTASNAVFNAGHQDDSNDL